MLPLSQFSLHTFLNSKTIRFHWAGVTSIGTRSLSCKLTPHAPALPRRAGILIPPEASEAHKISEWITPAIATVHRPICAPEGIGIVQGLRRSLSRTTKNRRDRRVHPAVCLVTFVHPLYCGGMRAPPSR